MYNEISKLSEQQLHVIIEFQTENGIFHTRRMMYQLIVSDRKTIYKGKKMYEIDKIHVYCINVQA